MARVAIALALTLTLTALSRAYKPKSNPNPNTNPNPNRCSHEPRSAVVLLSCTRHAYMLQACSHSAP